jgi:D-aspartate ligase
MGREPGQDYHMPDRPSVAVPVVVLTPGAQGHGIARSLGRLGVPVYGVFADPNSPAAKSRYWTQVFVWDVNAAAPQQSVEWLLELVLRIGSRPILIPTDDTSCLFVHDHQAILEQQFLFPLQPPGVPRALSNKRQMHALCEQYGVPAPTTLFPQSRDEVLAFLSHATFPTMLKVVDNSLASPQVRGKKVIARSGEELLSWYDELDTGGLPNLMLQEYIPGKEDRVWMFNGYFDEQSDCLFGLTGQKIRQHPPYGGVTSLGVCITNDEVITQTTTFMKALRYRGILDIGYKYDVRDGQYKLFDANPRIGATFRLFVDTHELDVVRVLYEALTRQTIVPGKPCEGRKWLVEPFDLAASVTYWRDGNLSFREWLGSLQRIEEGSWFAHDDMKPFLAVWSHLLFRRLRRLLLWDRKRPLWEHQDRIEQHFTAVSEYWSDVYTQHTVFAKIYQERLDVALRWIDELSLPAGSRVLDVGTGAGVLAVELARRGYVVDAIDPSEAMVRLARERASEAGINEKLTVEVGDAHALSFAAQSFDLVVALGVLPWLHSPSVAVTEMARVLKPRGYVLFTSDNRFRLSHFIDPRFAPALIPPALDPMKIAVKEVLLHSVGRHSTWRSSTTHSYGMLRKFLSSAGLAPIRHTTLGFGPFSIWRRTLLSEQTGIELHMWLQKAADRNTPGLRATGAQHVVLAERAATNRIDGGEVSK